MQRVGYRANADTELRQLGVVDIEIDSLVLHTVKVDFLDARHGAQALSRIASYLLHFSHRKTVAPQRDSCDGRIAELVVDHWADAALGKLGLNVMQLIAQLLPGSRQVLGRYLVCHFKVDDGFATLRRGPDIVQFAHRSGLFLNHSCDESLDPFRRHAGKFRRNERFADNDRWVLEARLL